MVKEVSLKFEQCFGAFTMLLLSDPLKRDFLGIVLTMFLGVRNFGNTSAMRVIFFLKMFQIEARFQNEEKN